MPHVITDRIAKRLAAAIESEGETAFSKRARVSRQSISRALAKQGIREGTALMIEKALEAK